MLWETINVMRDLSRLHDITTVLIRYGWGDFVRLIGVGSLQCFEETDFSESALLRADLGAEEYPLNPETARVERVAWTPNRIDLHVVARAPTEVVINQNHHRAWRTNLGEIRNHQGLLSVDLPAGDHQVRLTFRDPWITAGACIWISALLGLLVLVGRDVRLKIRTWQDHWRKLPWTCSVRPPQVESTK